MDYDVIIVGGRPAGASLAALLGARNIRVLVVDRATFPSLPQVPSSPILYPSAMSLLDELGIDETSYAPPDSRIYAFSLEMAGVFKTVLRMPKGARDRDYCVGLDRISFDQVLWDYLERYPTVERRSGFAVTDVLREGDRVAGIVGQIGDEPPQKITAGCVVGADGRFSLIARRVSAPVTLEQDEHTSTVYCANWKRIRPFADGEAGAFIYTTARGLDILFFRMPGGLCSVNTHARSDRVDIGGDAQSYYLNTIRSLPEAWSYLEGAEQVSPIVGIKKIGNGYRKASGPGWVLVGDAYHYKDPVDGQGIYDALLETKILDKVLPAWCKKEITWDEAMARYDKDAFDATLPMFQMTMGRLKRELYEEPPVPVLHTLIRWMLTDRGYQDCFLNVLSRNIPPASMESKSLLGGAVARGLSRDLRAVAGRFVSRMGSRG